MCIFPRNWVDLARAVCGWHSFDGKMLLCSAPGGNLEFWEDRNQSHFRAVIWPQQQFFDGGPKVCLALIFSTKRHFTGFSPKTRCLYLQRCAYQASTEKAKDLSVYFWGKKCSQSGRHFPWKIIISDVFLFWRTPKVRGESDAASISYGRWGAKRRKKTEMIGEKWGCNKITKLSPI